MLHFHIPTKIKEQSTCDEAPSEVMLVVFEKGPIPTKSVFPVFTVEIRWVSHSINQPP